MSDELFSYRLRKFRENHGLSMDALGKALGVTGRYIGMIERGDKDVEPSSSLYKLFVLIESKKVPIREVENDDVMSLREEATSYKVTPKTHTGLTLNDCVAQIYADLEVIQKGTNEESRRAYAFLIDVHMPLLGTLLTPKKHH